MGDINLDALKTDRKSLNLKNTLISHNITRLDLPATRVTPESETSIDCISTNLPIEHLSTKVTQSGLSDHTAQICTYNVELKLKEPSTMNRSLSMKNLLELKRFLKCENWENVSNALTTEDAYNTFFQILNLALEASYPLKLMRPKKKKEKQKQLKMSKAQT